MSTSPQPPVWFITAASSGFGKHIALSALSRGHRVIASARSLSRLSDLEAKGAHTIVCDVTSSFSDLQKVAKEANEKYGYITHVVNAAGYILVGAVEETTPEEDLASFHTNVLGPLNITKAFLPYLRNTPGHRTISFFGSIASWAGGAGYALYSTTKWAVSGASESLRAELAPFGISVTVIEPGYFRTGILNPGAQVHAANKMQCYEDTAVGELRKRLDETDGKQPGDVEKGSKVIVDILTMAGGREVPVRVVLGADAHGVVRGKCEGTLGLLGEWEGVTDRVGHEE